MISSSGCKRKIKAVFFFVFFFTEPARYSDEVKAAPYIDCNHNNDVCQASTLSAEEITKIKQLFLFNSKTKLSAFAKKKRLLLSIAIKKNFQ